MILKLEIQDLIKIGIKGHVSNRDAVSLRALRHFLDMQFRVWNKKRCEKVY